MKIFTKILIILTILFCSIAFAEESNLDTDGDGVIDSLDKEVTTYKSISGLTKEEKKFFEKKIKQIWKYNGYKDYEIIEIIAIDSNQNYIFNNGKILKDEIVNSLPKAKKTGKKYFFGGKEQNLGVIDEKKILKYVCNELDLERLKNLKHGCITDNLGKFSKQKFIEIKTNGDTDGDGIKDYNSNGDILDKEKNTSKSNKQYICTPYDISNEKYDCTENDLGKFSQAKKDNFIDTDGDGIKDSADKEKNTSKSNKQYICTPYDISNEKYDCTENDLGKFSQAKKDNFIDTDGDGIKDSADKEKNTSKSNKQYICTPYDISNEKYDCTENDLGKFSQAKKENFIASITEGLKTVENVNKKDYIDGSASNNILGDGSTTGQITEQQKEAYNTQMDQINSLDNASYAYNVQTGTPRNYRLRDFGKNVADFFGYRITGGQGIFYMLTQIAHSLKNLLFYFATIFYFIIALKLILVENTEEQVTKFKKGIVWITVGLIVIQIAYIYTLTLYAKRISELLAFDIIDNIINPLIGLMEVLASFFFLAIAIFTFYRLATAGGNEEEIKRAKMTIVYAIMGFILLKLAETIVNGVYGTLDCRVETVGGFDVITTNCLGAKTSGHLSEIFLTIINWINGFIGVITILLIIYVGFRLLLSRGEEEPIKKSKNAIIYIIIGLVLLAMNYLILTFFWVPEATI